jgi:hypothetical protein
MKGNTGITIVNPMMVRKADMAIKPSGPFSVLNIFNYIHIVIQKAGILQGATAGVTLVCFGLRRVVLLQDETNHEETPKQPCLTHATISTQ